MDPGAVGAISDMGPGNIVGVVDSPAQQEHELIEFRIKGTICKWCLPLEQYLEEMDDFWHHMRPKLQRAPGVGRSRLFRRR